MSERGVRGVRTVGGYRTPRRAHDIEDIEDIEDSGNPEDTTRTAVATDTRDEPYVVVTEEGLTGKRVPKAGPRPSSGIPRWLVGVLAVMAGVGMALALTFGILWNGKRVQDNNRAAAQHTAQNFLIALTNFDSKTINSDFKRITSYATGNFANQATQFFGPQIRQQLQVAQAQSRGEISSIYVQSASSNRASVYAVVDQTIVNKSFNAPQADELRVVLTMNKVSGGWRVGDVTVLQAPLTGTGGGSPSSPAPNPSP
jgi:hypothetical protein